MRRILLLATILSVAASARADEPPPVSFLKDIAPILNQNCVACHNPKKTESKYLITNFSAFTKGGAVGEGFTVVPKDAEGSYLVELVRPDGEPRMPYKQDPLKPDQIALIERWINEGAKYDGADPEEDWTALIRKTTTVAVPETYPVAVPVTAVAFSPDGSEIATSGYHEVNFWKTADGSLSRRLPGLGERVYDVAFSPDGKWMATASGNPGQSGSAKLWIAEPNGGKLVRDLVETEDVVYAVAFSPDSSMVAAAGADRAIHLFKTATGEDLATIEDHADWIYDVAFSPDGKRLVTASRDKTSKVFDVEKKESLVTFPGHAQPVYSALFTSDGKQVLSAGEDKLIRIWEPDNDGKQVRQIAGFGGFVFQVALAPDGKLGVASSADKTVRVFEPASGKILRTLAGNTDYVYSAAISKDGKTVASGSWNGEVHLWNLSDGKPLQTILAAPGLKPAETQAAR